MTILAAAQEPRQVGNFVGLLIAIAVISLAYNMHQRWMKLHDETHSPTRDQLALEGVKSQVNDLGDPEMTPRGVVAKRAATDLDEFVARQSGRRPRDVIRDAAARFGRSESTVKRAIRRTRGTTP